MTGHVAAHVAGHLAAHLGAASLALSLSALLGACAWPSLPTPPVQAAVYDLGPGLRGTAAATGFNAAMPLALAPVQAPAALDSTAMAYRLAYTNAQQLHAYAQARWSMAPAQLLHQRLGERLAQDGPVLSAGNPAARRELRVELEEFSQLFTTPLASEGLVRLRVTVLELNGPPTQAGPHTAVRQHRFSARRPAASANAPAGAQALAAAADALIEDLALWLRTP